MHRVGFPSGGNAAIFITINGLRINIKMIDGISGKAIEDEDLWNTLHRKTECTVASLLETTLQKKVFNVSVAYLELT